MKIYYSSNCLKHFLKSGSAVALGNYDGLHVGHRRILAQLIDEAHHRGLKSILYTFQPHPVALLAPQIAPPLINTLTQKIKLLSDQKINAVIFEKFTRDFAHLTPENFFKKFLINRLNAKFIIVGHDFTFGKKRSGNLETLEQLCHTHHIDVVIVEPCLEGDILVSSSLIRKYISEGKTRECISLLGRPFFIEGTVIKGKNRGKQIGFPTINLKTMNDLIPQNGVYATQTILNGRPYKSVTNIGTQPTFGGTKRSIETHILNLNKNLYKQFVRILFFDRLRDEITFKSSTELAHQIHQDITDAKKIEGHL